jgi:hypothetical protein
MRVLAVAGPMVSVATGLLFYFGWARTAAQSAAMGLDESLFSMSTRDYILRSLNALFLPLLIGVGVLLGWLSAHVALTNRLHQGRGTARTTRICGWVSRSAWFAVPLAVLLACSHEPAWRPVAGPLALAAGFVISEWAARIRAEGDRLLGRSPASGTTWAGPLRGVLVGVLVTAALFWEVTNFAQVVGRGLAEQVSATVAQRPSVVVYATLDLQLPPGDVRVQHLPGSAGDFRFRYSGLHLLQISGGKVFLLPAGWQPGTAPLIVVTEGRDVRMEFSGPPRQLV